MSEFEILTYRELSDRFGISLESVRKKVRRRQWRVVPGNRPSDPVRVHVPKEALQGFPLEEDEVDGRMAAAGLPATDPQLLATLKALEAYVGRVSGQQEQLLAQLGNLLSELAAKDKAHAEELRRVREEERERYREELDQISRVHEESRAERVQEINRLISDIERERTARAQDQEHHRTEMDRQWQAFLEERERHFESLEQQRMAAAKAEARAYRSEAAEKELRSALVTIVPRLETLLKPAAADQPTEDRPPLPPKFIKHAPPVSEEKAARNADDEHGPRRGWWPWRKR